ncbi:UNVERIFIED_CONTAM: 1-deoxy-D-xylulose-5-phosphate reductoisomerase, partial [Salmonella enterica subsp. enterica serovar Weltevreden]
VAVEAFLNHALTFTGIAELIEEVLSAAAGRGDAESLEDILRTDAWARSVATAAIARGKVHV